MQNFSEFAPTVDIGYLGGLLLEMAAYLDERAARRVRPRTAANGQNLAF